MGKTDKKTKGKTKYPDKTSINLLVNERDIGDKRFQIAVFIIFLIILAVFVKFFVVDRLTEAYTAKNNYETMQSQIADLEVHNKDYDKVREEYSHYGNGYLNDEEKEEQDRVLILNLLDSTVLSKADIQSVSISGNVATVTIDNIQLSTVSQIVSAVEARDEVSFVTVSTAGTDSSSAVTATMVITFKSNGGEAK